MLKPLFSFLARIFIKTSPRKLKIGDKFKQNGTLTAEVIDIKDNWVTYKMIDDVSLTFFKNNSYRNSFQFSENSENGKKALSNIL